MPNFRLDGKKALVTGAARGLGKAIADGLADSGATVYGTSRDAESARRSANGTGRPPLPVDVTRSTPIWRRFAEALMQESGGIDLLVNNAGVNVPKPALELTDEDWDTVFDTNLKGSFFLTTALARHWIDGGTQVLSSMSHRRPESSESRNARHTAPVKPA